MTSIPTSLMPKVTLDVQIFTYLNKNPEKWFNVTDIFKFLGRSPNITSQVYKVLTVLAKKELIVLRKCECTKSNMYKINKK